MAYSISTQGGIKNAILVKLGQTTTAAYYTDVILDDWIDDAHKWSAGYKKWPFTEGKISTTFSTSVTDDLGNYIMEYPEGWKADSIRILQVGGKMYDKKNFKDLQKAVEKNELDSDDRFYSDYARRIYVPSATGASGTMAVYGQYTPARLDGSVPTSETVFSNYDDDGNQAIVAEVLSYSAQREKKSQVEIQSYHKIATDLLDKLWGMIGDEQAMYQTAGGDGMYKRFDAVNGGFTEKFNTNQF